MANRCNPLIFFAVMAFVLGGCASHKSGSAVSPDTRQAVAKSEPRTIDESCSNNARLADASKASAKGFAVGLATGLASIVSPFLGGALMGAANDPTGSQARFAFDQTCKNVRQSYASCLSQGENYCNAQLTALAPEHRAYYCSLREFAKYDACTTIPAKYTEE